MKVSISVGEIIAKQNNVEVFRFEGFDFDVQYSEKEFLAMMDSYPKLLAALNEIAANAMKKGTLQ